MSDNHIIDESLNYLADFVSSSSAMAGVIKMYAGTTAPLGWLMCDGSAVSRTVYAKLFHVIGTTYGEGDGSTTFNVPDLRGRTPVGVGTGTASDATAHTLGQKAGTETHKLTSTQSGVPAHGHGFTQPKIPNHSHSMGNIFSNGSGSSDAYTMSSGKALRTRATATDGGGGSTTGGAVQQNTAADASQAHPNMQPYLAVNYIISTGMDIDLAPYSLDNASSFYKQVATSETVNIPATQYTWATIDAPENAVAVTGYYLKGTGNTVTLVYALYFDRANNQAKIALRNTASSQACALTIDIEFLCINTQPVFVDNTYSDKVDNLINQDKIKGTVQEFPYSVSVPANSERVIKTLSLPAGLWLIISHMGLSTGSGTSVYNHTLGGRTVRASEVNGGGSMNLVIRQHTETTNVELKAYSHVACTVGGSIYVINLGNALFEKMSS